MKKIRLSVGARKLLIPIALFVFAFIFFTIKTDNFASATNISAIFREMGTPLLVSCGMCFVMAAGYIDLSVGSVAALSCMFASRMIDLHLPILLVFLLMVVVAAGCGFANGVIVYKFDLHPFVGTLALQNVYRGIVYAINYIDEHGAHYTPSIKDPVVKFLNKGLAGGGMVLYFSFLAAILCIIICQIIFAKTKFGINIYAMGSNMKAAQLTGVNVEKVTYLAYTCCGIFTGICAIFLLAKNQAATSTLGTGLEFDAISALVVGGASAMGPAEHGEKASPVGAFFGALFLYTVYNGIYKLGVNSSYQQIIQGAALIIMLVVDGVVAMARNRSQEKRYHAEQDKIMMEEVANV